MGNTTLDKITSPLKSAQLNSLQALLGELSPIQTAWVSGYLANLNTNEVIAYNEVGSVIAETVAETAVLPINEKITILFGSQTGNAQDIATSLCEKLNSAGLQSQLISMDNYNVRTLGKENWLLFVVSTQGEGEPPESAFAFFSYLQSKRITRLEKLNFAVLGLGDSSYPKYNQAAKDLDERLKELGAVRLFDRLECDIDYQNSADYWGNNAIEKLKSLIPASNNRLVSIKETIKNPVERYSKNKPYVAKLVVNQKITTSNAQTDVHHLVISINPELFNYTAGDAVGIWFKNDPVVVNKLLITLGINDSNLVSIGGNQQEIRQALTERFEITRLHPGIVKDWAMLVNHERLNTIIDDQIRLKNYINNHQLLDLITEFSFDAHHQNPGNVHFDAEKLINFLQPLNPRLYSIASGCGEYDDEIHLTVGVLRHVSPGHVSPDSYQSSHLREQLGGASGFLTQRLKDEAELKIYLVKNNTFRLPVNNSVPIVMIAAGTGIAPYRAFLQQRAADNDSGENWLVFGNRHFHEDFLYQLEIQQYLQSGLLTDIDLAFSRDQQDKIYVQHRLLEKKAELYRWLEKGAHLYVCGSTQMGIAVHEALVSVVATEGGYCDEQAENYLKKLRLESRYQKDVY